MPGVAETRMPALSAPPWQSQKRFSLALNVSLAAILCLIAYLIWSSYQSSHREALVHTNNLAGILSADIESALDRAQSDLRVFQPQITATDLAGQASEERRIDLEARMGTHLRSFPAVINYRVFNGVGQSVFGAGSANPDTKIDVADRAWFQHLRDEPGLEFVLSEVVVGKATHDQTIILAVPIRNGDRQLQGALNAAVNLAYFQKLIDSLDIGDKGLVAVRRTDDFSLVLRRPAQAEMLNGAVTQGGLAGALRSGRASGDGDFVSGVDNLKRSYAFRQLHGYPLTVVVALASEDYLAPWRQQAALAGAVGLVLIAVVVVVHRREQTVRDRLGQAIGALQTSESRLANEADRFRQLLRTASDGIHILDTNGKLVMASDSFFAMLGYDTNNPPGLRVADWDAQWPPEELVERVRQIIAAPRTFYTRHRRRDGTVFDVEINARGVHLDNRDLLFASSRDVTERKRAEEVARRASLYARSLIEASLDPLVTIDPDGKITDVNLATEAATGRSRDELIGSDFCSCFTEPEEARIGYRKVFSEGRVTDYPLAIRHASGQITDVLYNAAVYRDEAGVVQGVFAAARDVTQRKRAEAASRHAQAELQTTLARLNLVLKTAAEGIIGIDDEQRVMFATPAAAVILGWPKPEEMVGKSLHDVTGHVLADGTSCLSGHCHIRKAMDGGETCRVTEESFTRADGTVFPVEYVVSPLVVAENVVGAVFAFHDIAERKAMEADLRRSNAELEQFAYVASHDLRQPLRMVSSYLSLVEKKLDPRLLSDEIKGFIGYAVGGAKRMDSLILGLLEYSRVGRNGESGPVALGDAVADALVNLTVAIHEAEAEVVVAGPLPTVRGNPTELTRLFQNLIGNAVTYRAPDRRPRIEIGCERKGNWWQISIGDNGIGIAPDDRERAFAIFQRLVPKETYDGTGIGLAICKKIVENQGGRIWIESQLGEGSTFFMTFPLAQKNLVP